jgi:hypothetical protein
MLVEMVRVRCINQSSRSDAIDMIAIDTAREMVESGLAKWSKGMKYLILLKVSAEIARTPQSLAMGPRVTELAVMGSEFHRALVQAWCPLMKAA